MGRLDDLYNEVQGGAPKSSGQGAGASSAFGVQTVTLKSSPKTSKQEGQKPEFEHRDLGTKKDPTKLRKQVLTSGEERDPIDAILHGPVEGMKKRSK